VQGMLADLAEQLEQGEGGMAAFLAFTSDASSTALGQQLAAAASELQSIAATNDITLNLSAAGGTSSGSTQRPPSTEATLVPVQVLTPDRGSSFTVEAGELFTLAVGATATVNGDRFAVRFDGIEGDSRCPGDVNCIRAGEAFAVLTVTSRAGEALMQIAVPPEGPAEGTVAGWKITIVELTPEAISTQTIEPTDYELHLYLQPTNDG